MAASERAIDWTIRAAKAAAEKKAGESKDYPTMDALRAEAEEEAPAVVLEVRDAEATADKARDEEAAARARVDVVLGMLLIGPADAETELGAPAGEHTEDLAAVDHPRVLSPPRDREVALEPAARIARGVRRALWQRGCASLLEVSLNNGRRADVLALDRSGEIMIIEIKSSVADFRADRKWPDYREYCDRFWFAVAEDFPLALIPEECGLLVADAFGAAVVREAPLLVVVPPVAAMPVTPAAAQASQPRRKSKSWSTARRRAQVAHALRMPNWRKPTSFTWMRP